MKRYKLITKYINFFILVGYLQTNLMAGLVTIFEEPALEKKTSRLIPVTSTMFVNGRVNEITITVTDNKNKTFYITIYPGQFYAYDHPAKSIKKCICSEPNEKNMTISESDLNNYEVFVFNTDQKTEKYYLKNIHSKQECLQKARDFNNIDAFYMIDEQNIYYP